MSTEENNPVVIPESGMNFGPFRPERLFYIEKSEAFQRLGSGYSTAEFICLDRQGRMCLVEAKTSISNPESAEDFRNNMQQIEKKFTDSYQLFLTCHLGRRSKRSMGDQILHLDMASTQVRFMLVIKNHKKEWLIHINETLNRNMRKTLKMWNIDIRVLNEDGAKELGLVQ